MKRALVGQFSGSGFPIQVIRSMQNWLWGYEGEVTVSLISDGFFLFEFASEALGEWVME
ncbi:hypothetical protein LINPERHAP1_LOCUS9289 [Linum perenne]